MGPSFDMSRAAGVGPEGLPRGLYKVEIVFVCRSDHTEMGRAVRYTPPDMDGEIETVPIPGPDVLPRSTEDGFEKWRFFCTKCGRDVPKSDTSVADMLDKIYAPWARRVVRVYL